MRRAPSQTLPKHISKSLPNNEALLSKLRENNNSNRIHQSSVAQGRSLTQTTLIVFVCMCCATMLCFLVTVSMLSNSINTRSVVGIGLTSDEVIQKLIFQDSTTTSSSSKIDPKDLKLDLSDLKDLKDNLHELNSVLDGHIKSLRVKNDAMQSRRSVTDQDSQNNNHMDVFNEIDSSKSKSRKIEMEKVSGASDSIPDHKETQQQQQQQQQQHKKIAIFFNTFQRNNETELAQSIIAEQLEQINQQPLLHSAPIYYTRFGDDSPSNNEFPTTTCTNDNQRQCVELMALEKGDESITLQSLYDHCVINENDIVLYIHTKGSFTPTEENNVLRNVLMKAVTSEECISSMTTIYDINNNNEEEDEEQSSSFTCDTCSSQFHGLPAHYPGNMWIANCNYVNKLIPPRFFSLKKQELLSTIKNATTIIDGTKKKRMTLDNGKTTLTYHTSKEWMLESPSMLGIDRFAMEQWIGSHPDLKPCDVFSPKNDDIPIFRYGTTIEKGIIPTKLELKLQKAPGMTMKEFWKEKNFVLHPWFKQSGRLYEYKALYGSEPDELSWFHSFWSESR